MQRKVAIHHIYRIELAAVIGPVWLQADVQVLIRLCMCAEGGRQKQDADQKLALWNEPGYSVATNECFQFVPPCRFFGLNGSE